jgi:hypothetical protein
MAATISGITGRSSSTARPGGTSGEYQLESVIACRNALHTCTTISTVPSS